MKKAGFTIVELLITIAVISILTALTVNTFSGLQKDARDKDRESDAGSIARHFEKYFSSQTPYYPATTSISNATLFNGLNAEALRAPGVSSTSPISLIAATNSLTSVTAVTPQPTINTYVYQPLTSSNTLCTNSGGCKKFNIYYYHEGSSSIKKITSLKQ